jgi:L-2-hydroxyglutarate oxidase LhgO
VLHAGFYYSPDSLKAKLTVDGNRKLKEFCQAEGVPVITCGKVVVAQHEDQVPLLHELKRRGDANGVELQLVDEVELNRLEPLAETRGLALWSPNTAVSDPKAVSKALRSKAERLGVTFQFDTQVQHLADEFVTTTSGQQIDFHHFVNAAGLYSDKIAQMQGFGEKYSMMPFIGLYHYAPALKGTLQRHIYPTPDPRNPFLGVHFTRTVDGSVKVGPTAIPLLSREQYSLLKGLSAREFIEILSNYPKFVTSGHHDVWSLVRTELPKLSRTHLLGEAKKLSSKIDLGEFNVFGKPGIRAQLFDRALGKLEMDFVVEGDAKSTHVLNAVSPGWTTCLSFAEYVVDGIEARQGAK